MTEDIRFDLVEADDFARYVLDGQTDIVFYLRAMKDRKANVSVYAGRANESFLTALLAIDEQRGVVVFDAPRDEKLMERSARSAPLVFLTSLERVKIQFMVPRCTLVEFEGSPAFEIPLPTRMLRLQRRDYYRLILPPNPRLRCLIPTGESGGRMVEATIVDISGGGLAVVAPPSSLSLSVDSLIDNCQITLPEVGTISATLQVRNVFRVTERGGTELRAGCQFIGLPGSADALIQRYILRMEKERADPQDA
ncbi:MAG: flagellar brake protein [Methyloversatilis sp.]|jgi:c-di-GMP-binding flagellar brake protein YcgR|nr:flagellar brake protein [Methyloversatilis sp.]MBP6194392.1 flagellar brake protein [Methyloversatilis sp.]MBP9117143.1 flagellar brake protein [Methyloversatilis sp.]